MSDVIFFFKIFIKCLKIFVIYWEIFIKFVLNKGIGFGVVELKNKKLKLDYILFI